MTKNILKIYWNNLKWINKENRIADLVSYFILDNTSSNFQNISLPLKEIKDKENKESGN